MKITKLIAFSFIAFISTNQINAQVSTNNDINSLSDSGTLKPIIKVEEYRYLEKKLVQNSSDKSLLDLFFGIDDNVESKSQNSTSNSRSNRVILPQMVGGLTTLFSHIEYPNHAKAKGIEGIELLILSVINMELKVL